MLQLEATFHVQGADLVNLVRLYPNYQLREGNLLLQPSLLHLQLQQVSLRTASRRCTISFVSVECIAAFIQLVDHGLTFVFFIIVFLQTV